ncbi:hypothetical protein ACQJBY_053480 [Aegilops geniculata]
MLFSKSLKLEVCVFVAYCTGVVPLPGSSSYTQVNYFWCSIVTTLKRNTIASNDPLRHTLLWGYGYKGMLHQRSGLLVHNMRALQPFYWG